tara:strand:- start:2620 stop:2922 length:303 start_codon:yes stop_codon:yes gene_type:complete
MNYLMEAVKLDKYNNPINWINKHYDNLGKKQAGYKNSTAHDADRNIFHCRECRQCWQWDKLRNNYADNKKLNKKLYYYFEDFPSYGKKKITCPKCERKSK